jgi:hypothetical protein
MPQRWPRQRSSCGVRRPRSGRCVAPGGRRSRGRRRLPTALVAQLATTETMLDAARPLREKRTRNSDGRRSALIRHLHARPARLQYVAFGVSGTTFVVLNGKCQYFPGEWRRKLQTHRNCARAGAQAGGAEVPRGRPPSAPWPAVRGCVHAGTSAAAGEPGAGRGHYALSFAALHRGSVFVVYAERGAGRVATPPSFTRRSPRVVLGRGSRQHGGHPAPGPQAYM